MTLLINQPIPIDQYNTYKIIGYHRGQSTNDKSVWNNSYQEEIDCFCQSLTRDWTAIKNNNLEAWGFQYNHGFQAIGIGTIPERKSLYIARFYCGQSKEWHGHPIDYTVVNHKVPDSVTTKWHDSGHITLRQKSKLKQGVECL